MNKIAQKAWKAIKRMRSSKETTGEKASKRRLKRATDESDAEKSGEETIKMDDIKSFIKKAKGRICFGFIFLSKS